MKHKCHTKGNTHSSMQVDYHLAKEWAGVDPIVREIPMLPRHLPQATLPVLPHILFTAHTIEREGERERGGGFIIDKKMICIIHYMNCTYMCT